MSGAIVYGSVLYKYGRVHVYQSLLPAKRVVMMYRINWIF